MAGDSSQTYMVVYATVNDMSRFKEYSAKALALIESSGGKRLSLGKASVLEGQQGWRGGAIYVWPSKEAAQAFCHSPEYEALKQIREGAADIEAVLIG